MVEFAKWAAEFEARAGRRSAAGDPDWARGAGLHPAIVRSVQRFQVGESGDGANLIGKADAAGPGDYPAAVRWFVAEESDHARLLALLLDAAGAPTIRTHWSDTVFVRVRRALGLRLELMVLMIAEVVALGYYRALRDGVEEGLASEVAGRILADEEFHVPFHCERLRAGFAGQSPMARRVVAGSWRAMFAGALLAVVVDHGSALHRLGVGRARFAVEVFGLFDAAVASAMAQAR
jgi:hypothetical protein